MSAGYPYRHPGCLLCELAEVLEASEYQLSEFAELGDAEWHEYDQVFHDRKMLGKMHDPEGLRP
jgi:hypothetical protein